MLKEKNKHNIFLYILLGSCTLSIASSFYFFYFKKNFDFIVETKCDPTTSTCFYRDCTNTDICPPNGLSYYDIYSLKAKDFKFCPNEDCTDVCSSGVINCIKKECNKDDLIQGTCVFPNNNQ